MGESMGATRQQEYAGEELTVAETEIVATEQPTEPEPEEGSSGSEVSGGDSDEEQDDIIWHGGPEKP
jgi:hypothetical protein